MPGAAENKSWPRKTGKHDIEDLTQNSKVKDLDTARAPREQLQTYKRVPEQYIIRSCPTWDSPLKQ